jgi:hypothetical protein
VALDHFVDAVGEEPVPLAVDGCRGLGAGGLDETEDLPRRKIDPVLLERDAVVGLVVQVDLVGPFQRLEREPLGSLLVDVQIERYGTSPFGAFDLFRKASVSPLELH